MSEVKLSSSFYVHDFSNENQTKTPRNIMNIYETNAQGIMLPFYFRTEQKVKEDEK